VNKTFSSALALAAVIPGILSAQNPAPAPTYRHPAMAEAAAAPAERRMVVRSMLDRPMMAPAMMMDAASMFLGCTGELQLTDAQVTKLASIARRSQARQDAMRARMDSIVATRSSDGQDGAGMMMTVVMRRAMPTDAERKAQHEDDRDAFAVLTADQLATAWESMSMHHAMKMRP
jgi:hypothetical protein